MLSQHCWPKSSKMLRTGIQIVFGLKISSEYEHEYHYSVSTIRILFELLPIYSLSSASARVTSVKSGSNKIITNEEKLLAMFTQVTIGLKKNFL